MTVPFIILSGAAGAAASSFIPGAALRYAGMKSERKASPRPVLTDISKKKWMCAAAGGLFTGICAAYCPAWKVIFAAAFVWTALFGIIVDSLMRIIGNEMLMWLFGLGIIYRFLCGGMKAAWSGTKALFLSLLIFIAAAFIMKLLTGRRGVGMGDIKLSMTAAFIAGMEHLPLFLTGMCAAMAVYVLLGLKTRMLTLKSSFPMCMPLMAGLLISFSYELLPVIREAAGLL